MLKLVKRRLPGPACHSMAASCELIMRRHERKAAAAAAAAVSEAGVAVASATPLAALPAAALAEAGAGLATEEVVVEAAVALVTEEAGVAAVVLAGRRIPTRGPFKTSRDLRPLLTTKVELVPAALKLKVASERNWKRRNKFRKIAQPR